VTEHLPTEPLFVPASRADTASIPTNLAKPHRKLGGFAWAGIITGGGLIILNGVLLWMSLALR